jgi:hypothetical protein
MSDETGKYRTIDEIERLVKAFERCTLPRCEWTHQAHLIVALWCLTHYSQLEATNFIRYRIQKYNLAHGIQTTKNSGYHETITLFWVQMVRQYLEVAGVNRSIVELANPLIQNYGNPHLTLEYYSRDLLMSQEARRSWVEPDLKSL